MDATYIEAVRLLLEAIPVLFKEPRFAMKGGTAINLFVQDLPRLSVDIDVVFTDHTVPREAALHMIGAALEVARTELNRRGLQADSPVRTQGDESKLFLRRSRQQVKVEARQRLRREFRSRLTDDHRQFLLGLVRGEPPWEAMRCRHLSELPAIRWKLQNLAKLKRSSPDKYERQARDLTEGFGR
jgi:hypothetical protein